MKVLQVFDFFTPSGGGTVDLIRKLARALAQRGHEVVIYTSDFKLDQPFIGSLPEVKVYPFHCWSGLAGFYLMPGLIGEARRNLKDFDIIHLHCYRSFQNMVIHHYAKKYGVPYVLDAHGSLPRKRGKRGLKWFFDVTYGNRILSNASRVIAETEAGIDEYQEFGVARDKIALITPPFAVEEFDNLPPHGLFRHKFNLQNNHVIMFLGRINWIKGLDFLVESFYELAKARNNITLAIVGNDDGYKSTLQKLTDKLKLQEKVLFTGFLSGTDKLSALVDADIVVQPSIYEYGTGVPFEAILCNTPVIVSKDTSASENIRRIDAGYLVEYGNRIEMRDTILHILDNPVEAKGKTQKAKEYIKANLSTQKVVERYEQLYAECTATRKGIEQI